MVGALLMSSGGLCVSRMASRLGHAFAEPKSACGGQKVENGQRLTGAVNRTSLQSGPGCPQESESQCEFGMIQSLALTQGVLPVLQIATMFIQIARQSVTGFKPSVTFQTSNVTSHQSGVTFHQHRVTKLKPSVTTISSNHWITVIIHRRSASGQ
jgi:hypothetical protein